MDGGRDSWGWVGQRRWRAVELMSEAWSWGGEVHGGRLEVDPWKGVWGGGERQSGGRSWGRKLSGIPPPPWCSLLEGWLDFGQGGAGDELVELYSQLISIISHMAEVLLHYH